MSSAQTQSPCDQRVNSNPACRGMLFPLPSCTSPCTALLSLWPSHCICLEKEKKKGHFLRERQTSTKPGSCLLLRHIPELWGAELEVRCRGEKWCTCDAWWEKRGVGIMECGSSLKCAEQFFLNTSVFNLHYVNDCCSPCWERAVCVLLLSVYYLFPAANRSSSLL